MIGFYIKLFPDFSNFKSVCFSYVAKWVRNFNFLSKKYLINFIEFNLLIIHVIKLIYLLFLILFFYMVLICYFHSAACTSKIAEPFVVPFIFTKSDTYLFDGEK